jgi:hypothetical protein
VVPCPFDVGEAKVDEFDVVLLAKAVELVDVVDKFAHGLSLRILKYRVLYQKGGKRQVNGLYKN